MVDKRKNIKRKLRRLRYLKRSESHDKSSSKSDTLISSMEALIRKMSMTPTSAVPSTIVSNPPAPIQPQSSKEDIVNEIARQREIDMLRSQVQYMYNKTDEDIKARRSTGEMMAAMQARGTNLKPKDFGIDEDDEIYKVQKDAAKSKQRQFTLARHEILDQKEIARNERAVLHDTLSQSLINKLQNMATTPLKNSNKPLAQSTSLQLTLPSTVFEEREAMLSPPSNNYKKTPTKLSHLFDSEAGKPMTPDKLSSNGSCPQLPGTPRSSPPSSPSSPSSVASDDSISTYADDLNKMQLAADDFAIIERTAQQFADKSFEEVGDTTAKLAVKQKIDEFSQQQYDNNRDAMLSQYNALRDTNDKIGKRMRELIESFDTLSPKRRLEKALYYSSIANDIRNRIHDLETKIIRKKSAIDDAKYYVNHEKNPIKQSQYKAKLQYNIDLLEQMKKELAQQKQNLKDSSANSIDVLQLERTQKMKDLEDEINAKISNDAELQQLRKLRDNLQYWINTDNRRSDVGFNTDPNGAKEALENYNIYVQQHVQKLSEEGET